MYGGKINGYAKNSSCVLVATEGGIFKTTNEGQSWSNATQTFDTRSVRCNQIVSIGDAFFAKTNYSYGTSVCTSIDNGDTWTPLTFSSWWPQSLGKISNTLYMIGSDNISGGRLYSSIDGNTWVPKAQIWSGMGQSGNCELLTFNQDKLYIVYNNALYYTTDGNTMVPVSVNGLESSSFFDGDTEIDGDALGNLYYKANNHLYKYNFTLETWSDISTGKIPVEHQIMNLSATDHAIFVSAMTSTLVMKIYRSTDQGLTFTELTSTGIETPMIANIIEVSTDGFIGNNLDNCILISSDGGSTWSLNENQYIATYSGNLTRSGNTIIYSIEIKGFINSTNNGINWSAANNGIPGFGGIAFFVDEIIQVKDTLFSFVRPNPFSKQVQLYKSTDNGTSWVSSAIPSPYDTGEEYTFAGKCDSALFVKYFDTSSSKYALIVSFDYGSSWREANSQKSDEQIYLKGSKKCLFAFYAPINNWEDFSNIFQTNDFGTSFIDINTGNLFNNNFYIKRLNVNNWDKNGAMMDYDTINGKAIFAIRDRTVENGIDRLYLFNMNSNAWSEIITSGLPANYVANSIKYIDNGNWLLATNLGLYESLNGGIEWTATHNETNWQKGIIVNSIQKIADKVFLGTIANGVWLVDLTTEISEEGIDNDVQVFPNPTLGIIQVIIPDFNGTASVKLIGSEGKEILNKTVDKNQFQLDLNDYPSGSYFIVINSNNHTYRKRIIRK